MTDQLTHPDVAPAGAPLASAPPGPDGSPFFMDVAALFHFADGNTVFMGPVLSGGPTFITSAAPRHCDLVLDGQVVQSLTLVGERMPPIPKRGEVPTRVVYTADPVALDRAAVDGHACRLVEHGA